MFHPQLKSPDRLLSTGVYTSLLDSNVADAGENKSQDLIKWKVRPRVCDWTVPMKYEILLLFPPQLKVPLQQQQQNVAAKQNEDSSLKMLWEKNGDFDSAVMKKASNKTSESADGSNPHLRLVSSKTPWTLLRTANPDETMFLYCNNDIPRWSHHDVIQAIRWRMTGQTKWDKVRHEALTKESCRICRISWTDFWTLILQSSFQP